MRPFRGSVVGRILEGMLLQLSYSDDRKGEFAQASPISRIVHFFSQVWKQSYFILGIIAFSMAHIMYTIAFGFERAHWLVGISLGIFAVLFWQYVSKFIKGIMVKAVLVYACIIATMLWRAIARIDQISDLKDSWTKLCSCVGKLCSSLLLSDLQTSFCGFQ